MLRAPAPSTGSASLHTEAGGRILLQIPFAGRSTWGAPRTRTMTTFGAVASRSRSVLSQHDAQQFFLPSQQEWGRSGRVLRLAEPTARPARTSGQLASWKIPTETGASIGASLHEGASKENEAVTMEAISRTLQMQLRQEREVLTGDINKAMTQVNARVDDIEAVLGRKLCQGIVSGER